MKKMLSINPDDFDIVKQAELLYAEFVKHEIKPDVTFLNGGDYMNIKKYVFGDFRDNVLLRILITPYKSYIYRKTYNKYIISGEPEKIKKFKNCNMGKRCFIIGNGPSLKAKDLDILKTEITMAANRIYDIFDKTEWRPTYYFSIDNRGMVDMMPNIERLNLPNIFLAYASKKYQRSGHQNITYIMEKKNYEPFMYDDRKVHISEDVSEYFSNGYTVLFTALQFAIYMGIKEVYLLGVDFNYTYVIDRYGRTKRIEGVVDYFNGKKNKGSRLVYYSVLHAWEAAKKYADEHEIKIYNATRGGKLEVFERIDFDSIIR